MSELTGMPALLAMLELDDALALESEQPDPPLPPEVLQSVLAKVSWGRRRSRWVTTAVEADERVYGAVALHPTRANVLTDAARAELELLAAHPRVVAVGETGMDLYWPGRLDGCATPAEQREGFAWHIDLAKRTGKPLMIHNRDADAEVLDVLRAEGAPETVIFHCFSSGPEMAHTCVEAGWVLSLSGTVSFRNAHELREAARL
nr:TatD family hydrolase [Streptomyces sp. DSM 41633]